MRVLVHQAALSWWHFLCTIFLFHFFFSQIKFSSQLRTSCYHFCLQSIHYALLQTEISWELPLEIMSIYIKRVIFLVEVEARKSLIYLKHGRVGFYFFECFLPEVHGGIQGWVGFGTWYFDLVVSNPARGGELELDDHWGPFPRNHSIILWSSDVIRMEENNIGLRIEILVP